MSSAGTVPAEHAATAFHDLHGRAPAGVWSAPGRVNLIGEHTDYNDGYVLPFALPHRVAVAAHGRADDLLTASTIGRDGRVQRAEPMTIGSLEPSAVHGWPGYLAGVAWVLRSEGFTKGADLVLTSDVPTGAGLSSSAALECATALALLGVADTRASSPPSRETLARWTQRAENEFVGVPSGILDQAASLCCGEGHVLFLDVRSAQQEQVPFRVLDEGLEILVIDTRTNHALVDSEYGDRRTGCERAAELLGVPALRDVPFDRLDSASAELPENLRPLLRHVVTENQRVLDTVDALRSGRIDTIGELLTASHASLRDDYRVSCHELDLAVRSALDAGARGARMVGGGFGGSAIALVPAPLREDVETAVTAAFQRAGLRQPRTFTAVPSPGARQDS